MHPLFNPPTTSTQAPSQIMPPLEDFTPVLRPIPEHSNAYFYSEPELKKSFGLKKIFGGGKKKKIVVSPHAAEEKTAPKPIEEEETVATCTTPPACPKTIFWIGRDVMGVGFFGGEMIDIVKILRFFA